jgi:glycine betaine catabolism B
MHDPTIVKGRIADLLAFTRLVSLRRKTIKSASPVQAPKDPVNETVRLMHPRTMHLRVSNVSQETESTRTFTLEPDGSRGTTRLATFRAGQYLNIKVTIDGHTVTRNYSLSSTPADAAVGRYRITVRRKQGGYATGHIFDAWKEGTLLESSGPVGTFVYEALRDKKRVTAIAGGCGITPIYSMARDLVERGADAQFTILYGVRDSRDIIFEAGLRNLESSSGGRIRVHFVASNPDSGWTGPTGFITAKLIAELAGATTDTSFFICGPQAMYTFVDKELAGLSIPRRLVRRELFGEIDEPVKLPGFPRENASRTYTLTVRMADEVREIQASGGETILVALERAGLESPSRCRSGECGWCRAKLISGNLFISPMHDGRRIADRKHEWVHPCSSYPLSDVEMRVSRSL